MSAKTTYRFTVDEYHRLGEAGIFGEDDRIELLEGELIIMSPSGLRHAALVNRLNRLLGKIGRDRWLIGAQNPVRLGNLSEPQPDITLLLPRPDDYESKTPQPDDIFLLVEVADSSIYYDREEKLPVYAFNRIREVWIVNLVEDQVEIYRNPEGEAYRTRRIAKSGDTIAPFAFSDAEIAVSELLRTPPATGAAC